MIRALFVLLLITALTGALLRGLFPTDVMTRFEPIRTSAQRMVGHAEPDPARRAALVAGLDAKFATHALATRTHIISGAALLLLIPFQFSRSFRSRHRRVHRWMGRFAILAAWIVGLGGLFFGVLHPFAGTPERVTSGIIGVFFIVAVSIAFTRIRQGRVDEHREWMIRGMAAALAVATVRWVALPLDLVLTALGMSAQTILVASFWVGWGSTLAGAEWWVRRTRRAVA